MPDNEKLINEDNLARVQDLLACMQKGDEDGAREVVDELTRIRESTLYKEMGKLTRELHDAISAFGMDDRIANMAEHEIPDARQRLNYVITKTDEAANKTLSAIEETFPTIEALSESAQQLQDGWLRFTRREMDANEFREMSKNITEYFEKHDSDFNSVKSHLNEILMAQDFQDLTGQIIKKVIKLVEDVEGNLVNLIKVTGAPQLIKKQEESLQGPVVPGMEHAETVSGQDEVDDLLSSLGF